jgi:ferredoxin
MKFKDYSSDNIDFPGISPASSFKGEYKQDRISHGLIINGLPAYPYDFPALPMLLDLMKDHPDFLDTLKEKYAIPELVLLVSTKQKSMIRQYGSFLKKKCKIVFKKPVYPATEKRIASMTGVKQFSVMTWFEFYTLLAGEKNQPVPGIPVSVSYPAQNIRTRVLVPKKTPAGDIAQAAGIKWDDTVICITHPFHNTHMEKDTIIEEEKPHTMIFFPRNTRQPPSLWLKIKFMVCGSCSVHFSNIYDSRPLQLDTPCQNCLYCTKICPAHLAPLMLSALYIAENIKEALKHSPEKCIECGLCSYICPSGIPLLHNIKRLKKDTGVSS